MAYNEWGKIECIKVARLHGDFGLVDAKGMVETFFRVYDIDCIDNLETAMKFERFLRAFKDGRFQIKDGLVVYGLPAQVSVEDIVKACENR